VTRRFALATRFAYLRAPIAIGAELLQDELPALAPEAHVAFEVA
jgi:hypothetical protein